MKPNIDIINDFSALQQTCNELGKSNVALAQENARLRDVVRMIITDADTPSGLFWPDVVGAARDILSNAASEGRSE
jgi:hypothetical protein